MKRSPLRRGIGLQRRTRLNPVSKRRLSLAPERTKVRLAVLRRDGGCCGEGVPGVPHGGIGDRLPLEVHELAGGSRRHETFIDAGWAVAVCPQTHGWIDDFPAEAERVGLRLASWETDPTVAQIRRIQAGGIR